MKQLVVMILMLVMTLFGQTPIAVLDFLSNGLSENEARALTDRFRNEIFQFEIFDLMERGFMEEILDEQGFQLSGCTSDECVIEAGKLIGVEQIVGGSISRVGKTYTIAARIISVETGKILNTATYDYTGEIDMLLKEGMQQVAAELAYEKPPEEKFGYLTVKTKTPNTTIFLKDKSYRTNSIIGKKLIEEDYNLSLKSKYFFTLDTIVSIRNKDDVRLHLNLKPQVKKIQKDLQNKRKFKRSFYFISVVSFSAAAYLKYSADELYDEYKTAESSANSKHEDIEFRDNAAFGCTAMGVISLIPAIKYSRDVKILKNLLSMEAQYKHNEFRLAMEVGL